jgi:hypothetical protein
MYNAAGRAAGFVLHLFKEKRMKRNSRTFAATRYSLISILILAALLAGCSGATATLEPTVDMGPTLAMVQTQAAQTVVADLTMNAPTATPIVFTDTPAPTATTAPTNTPEPTATPTFVIPTPTATNTRVAVTLAPTFTNTPSNLACRIEEQVVSVGDDFPPNADFDGRWRIENTGTQTWSASQVDVRYVSGTEFHVNDDAFDLPTDVDPGEEITIVIDMKAPSSGGRYTTNWALVQGSTTVCLMSVTLDVVQ